MRVLAVLALALLAGCGTVWRDTGAPMTPVADLDLERYAGRWYEVARFPVPFQRGCTATTAEYGPPVGDEVSVRNTCRQRSPDGPVRQIAGRATVVGPGQLQVRLGRIPFPGAYWVLWVTPDYDTAVVGVPSGRAGWILHRSPDIPSDRLNQARAVLAGAGYDLSHLITTEH